MTSLQPDFIMLCVCACSGVRRITKEHFAAALALDIPVFCVITKADLAAPAQLARTLTTVRTLLATAPLTAAGERASVNDASTDECSDAEARPRSSSGRHAAQPRSSGAEAVDSAGDAGAEEGADGPWRNSVRCSSSHLDDASNAMPGSLLMLVHCPVSIDARVQHMFPADAGLGLLLLFMCCYRRSTGNVSSYADAFPSSVLMRAEYRPNC
jgi:hypothetical protein